MQCFRNKLPKLIQTKHWLLIENWFKEAPKMLEKWKKKKELNLWTGLWSSM